MIHVDGEDVRVRGDENELASEFLTILNELMEQDIITGLDRIQIRVETKRPKFITISKGGY